MKASFIDAHLNCLRLSEDPQVHLIWKPNLLIQGQRVRPDALIHYQVGQTMTTVLVEIDEGDITPQSLRREELLELPTVRITPSDLIDVNFFAQLLERVAALVTPPKGRRKRRGWLSFD